MSERPRRGPIDTRLLSATRSARRALAGSVLVGLAMTGALLAQLVAIATIIGRVFAERHGAIGDGIGAPLAVLAAAVAARVALGALGEVVAAHGGTAMRTELRKGLLRHVVDASPTARPSELSGEQLVVATRGVDAVEQYVASYLPQLVLAACAPVMLLVWMLSADRLSVAIILVALCVGPVFMTLLGMEAASRMRTQWAELSRLSGHFSEVVRGLLTLKLFDRIENQLRTIAETTERLRKATMAALRVAFLSALAFELLASVATAFVAMVLGLRLLSGSVGLATALAVLFVTPEVFLPLRKASARFHSAADGVGSSDRVLDLLEAGGGASTGDDASLGARRAEGLEGRARLDGAVPAGAEPSRLVPGRRLAEVRDAIFEHPASGFVVGPLDLTIAPGERIAILGETGSGKSTLLAALLGYLPPSSGQLVLGEPGLAPADWRASVSWMPQSAGLVHGSVLENVTLTSPGSGRADAWAALERTGSADLVRSLPDGIDTVVGDGGIPVSSGERQRLCLARAWCRPAELYLLDEPTSHLDRAAEESVLDGLFGAAASLRPGASGSRAPRPAAVVVTHSAAVAARCDRTLELPVSLVRSPVRWSA